MSKCSSFCGGTLPPIAFDACKSDPRTGGIPYLLFKTCDVCVPENAFIAGTSTIDRNVWEPLFTECKFRISPELVGEKGEASTNSLRTGSCRPERAIGGTQPIEFRDYTNSDNFADYDFWIEIQANQNSYQVGWFTCDDRFYGFFNFSIDVSEIIEDSNEGTSYRQGTITIPKYSLLKPLRADGLLSLAQEYSGYDCISGGYAYETEYLGEDSDFYGCVDFTPPTPPCTSSCIDTIYQPNVVKMNDDADPTNIVRFYYPNSVSEDCRSPWDNNQITITYGPDTVEGGGGEFTTNFVGDLTALNQLVPAFQAPNTFTRRYQEVEFLTDGVKYINVEVIWDPANVSEPNDTCTTLSQTYTFNTDTIDNASELCPGPLISSINCGLADFISGLDITLETPTTVSMTPDFTFLLTGDTGDGPDGCFGESDLGVGQNEIFFQITSDADPAYVSSVQRVSTNFAPFISGIPTYPAGTPTTLSLVYTTGPLRPADFVDVGSDFYVVHFCEPSVGTPLIEITFDIGTL